MFAPQPVEPLHECPTCRYAQSGCEVLLCAHGSMSRRIEINRARRGMCGPQGLMWQPKPGCREIVNESKRKS